MKIIISFYQLILVARQQNTNLRIHQFLVLNISLWFPKAANGINGGSPFMFSLFCTVQNLVSTF